MGNEAHIKEDLVTVKLENPARKIVLAWGDPVEVLEYKGGRTKIRIRERGARSVTGTVRGRLPVQQDGVLQFSMVDVQQGDGMVLQTPNGKKILIDGGDNKLFARYLAARYRNTAEDKPLEVDAIIVTHGDADHFAGLNVIRDSETHTVARKRLFIHPKRIYHNGLVKGPSALKPEKIFGQTVKTRSGRAVVALVDDLTSVPPARLNRPFKQWVRSIKHWSRRGAIDIRRLAFGDKAEFRFLKDEDITVEVLGPIPTKVRVRNKRKDGLDLLREPPKSVLLPLDEDEHPGEPAYSASHTVNGHSVAMRICYGNVRFFLSGDLNQEAMERLRDKVPAKELQCEVLKVPHHGSADFDLKALEAFSPVVSLISSGDESSRKEYIHPRATLMSALGKVGRGKLGLVFCTELAAFFELRGLSKALSSGQRYFGFERTNFGIIQIRTDGKRVLVFTHSGRETLKEAYRFTVNDDHTVSFAKDVKKR